VTKVYLWLSAVHAIKRWDSTYKQALTAFFHSLYNQLFNNSESRYSSVITVIRLLKIGVGFPEESKVLLFSSSVGIATGYGLHGRGSIPGWGKRSFCYAKRRDRL
jgi:hypothetical protein